VAWVGGVGGSRHGPGEVVAFVGGLVVVVVVLVGGLVVVGEIERHTRGVEVPGVVVATVVVAGVVVCAVVVSCAVPSSAWPPQAARPLPAMAAAMNLARRAKIRSRVDRFWSRSFGALVSLVVHAVSGDFVSSASLDMASSSGTECR